MNKNPAESGPEHQTAAEKYVAANKRLQEHIVREHGEFLGWVGNIRYYVYKDKAYCMAEMTEVNLGDQTVEQFRAQTLLLTRPHSSICPYELFAAAREWAAKQKGLGYDIGEFLTLIETTQFIGCHLRWTGS